jgi:hypothetical protein
MSEVDEYGRVFDRTKNGVAPFYDGLYIADRIDYSNGFRSEPFSHYFSTVASYR